MYGTPNASPSSYFSQGAAGRLITSSPRVSTVTDPAASSPAALFLSAFTPTHAQSQLPFGGHGAQEDKEELVEGAVVGDFTLGPIIAHGGFSTIRRATSSANAVVAVKIVERPRSAPASRHTSSFNSRNPPSYPADPNEASRERTLAHEERIWSTLSHEHILPLFACVHTPRYVCFVTQLCPAGSLFDLVRGASVGSPATVNASLPGAPNATPDANPNPSNTLPPHESARLFRQVVRGLRYLHLERGIVHGDIKLENVLVDECGAARISDFGMARESASTAQLPNDGGNAPFDSDSNAVSGLPTLAALPIPIPGAQVHRAVSLAAPGAHGRRGYTHNQSHNHPHAPYDPARDTGFPSPPDASDDASADDEEFQPGSLPYAAPELLVRSSGRKGGSAFVNGSKAGGVTGRANSVFAAGPSQAQTRRRAPHPAQDIWALGVLLYALLAGRLPFQDAFEPRLVLKILGGTYPPLPSISPHTRAVLSGCLAQRVQDRWTVERVDEASWAVGGEGEDDDADGLAEMSTSPQQPSSARLHSVDMDGATATRCQDGAVTPRRQDDVAFASPAASANAPDRGRLARPPLDAAVRRMSDRAERSESRAPYSPLRSAGSRSRVRRMPSSGGSRDRSGEAREEVEVLEAPCEETQAPAVAETSRHVEASAPAPADRGRAVRPPPLDAASRRMSDRAERSGSRAPYTPPLRSGENGSRVRRMPSASLDRARESRDRYERAEDSKSRSRSRSRSGGPPTPVDAVPVVLGGGLNPKMGMGIGLGFPSGKGFGKARAAGEAIEEGSADDGEADGGGMDRQREADAKMLVAPEAEARRAESTPPVAWRGTAGGSAAGRSRSLSGTG